MTRLSRAAECDRAAASTPGLTSRAPIDDHESIPHTATLGEQFAHALADKDADRMRDVLHPDVDFRGLTPSRGWKRSERSETGSPR
jgi:hypothetical protein